MSDPDVQTMVGHGHMRRDATLTTTALLTLSLTIGAVGMFSLVNALLLRELPVSHHEQLVKIATVFRTDLHANLSLPMGPRGADALRTE